MKAVLLLVALAACGGSTPPATHVEEGPVPPLDADPGEPALEQLELRAERACHCTDDGCRADVLTSLHDLDAETFRKSDRLRDAQHHLVSCLEPVLDPLLMATLEALDLFTQNGCACEDDECTTAVSRELLAWMNGADTPTAALLASHPLVVEQITHFIECTSWQGFDR